MVHTLLHYICDFLVFSDQCKQKHQYNWIYVVSPHQIFVSCLAVVCYVSCTFLGVTLGNQKLSSIFISKTSLVCQCMCHVYGDLHDSWGHLETILFLSSTRLRLHNFVLCRSCSRKEYLGSGGGVTINTF